MAEETFDVPAEDTAGDAPPTDGEDEKQLTVAVEFPKRRISLSYGEQNVEVEGPDDLDELSRLASSLWMLTTPPTTARLGFAAGGTLVTEIHPGEYGAGGPDPDDQQEAA